MQVAEFVLAIPTEKLVDKETAVECLPLSHVDNSRDANSK